MSDEELARIEKWLADVPEIESSWAAAIVTQDVASLIAEVRRLKTEAETIEVLREWLRKCGQKLLADEREIIENSEFSSPEDVTEANRRIAALEGK